MSSRVLRLVPVAIVAVGLVFVTSTSGASPPANGRIAFTKTTDQAEIWIMQANGTRKTRLVGDLGVGYEPVMSPNGKQLAYVSNRDGDTEIYVARADGTHPRQVTHNGGIDFDPAWSPNGTRLAFASNRTGDMEIYSMSAAGTSVRQLTHTRGSDESPAWSPDGRHLAFGSDRAGNDDVYVMSSDGTHQRRLTVSTRDEFFPAWSPDGATIAYTLYDEGDQIWVMDAQGGGQHRAIEYGGKPAWSSDGARFVYVSDDGIEVADIDGRHEHVVAASGGSPAWVGTRIVYTRRDFANDEIAEVDPSGAAERRVTTYPGYDGHPAWGPNGTLAFTRELADGSNRIYELDVDGSLHALVDLPIDQDEVSWSPDGSRIAFIADVPPWRIFVLTVATGEVRALDTYGGERSDWDPAWSPDGRWIAFASSRGDSYDLFVYDTVGGGLRRLTSGLHDEWCPSWSPDGQTIVFAGDEKGTFGIWAVPARGGTPRQLTRVAHGNDYHPTWSPDGTLIAFDRTLEDETEAIYTVRPDGTSLHRVTQSPEPAYEPAWQAAGRGREALTQ